MRRLWIAVALALIASPIRPGAQAGRPRLLVVIVVDQLRADELDLYQKRWRGGFRTLLDQGAHFPDAEYPYLNTATCAGHATIATGALPRRHGIVLNRWWDRAAGRSTTCTDDPGSPQVSYGAPSTAGHSARLLLTPTLGDALRRQQPGARVVSLALKPRSAAMLAGHGGDVVTWFDDQVRSFVTARAYSAEPVASVARFLAADTPGTTGDLVWTLRDAPARYRHADLQPTERPKAGWTTIFPHAIAGVNGADAQFFDRWQKSPFADRYLGALAAAVSDDLQLGRRDATDYLAISFSSLDLMGHDFGPDSREVEDLLLHLDDTLGRLLEHLDATVGRDRYVVALSSDHGTAPVPERVADGGRIASEDVQQLLEQTLAARWDAAPAGQPYVAWVGPGSVYFGAGIYERLRGEAAAMRDVIEALTSVPGVERVLRSDMLAAAASDPLVRATAAGYVADRSGDLFLLPRRHWIFELRSEYDGTNHGTFHDYDRSVPVVVRGAGIRAGRYRQPASPMDVAPTLAHIAGIRLDDADGRVLSEAIR
jgi:predicted AlkP superfamily pyrophosphatase or phosphodiesterase